MFTDEEWKGQHGGGLLRYFQVPTATSAFSTPAAACILNTSSIDFFVTNAASSPSTSNAATPQSSQSSSIPKAGRPLKEVFQPQLSSIGVSSPSGQAPAAKQPGRRNLSWSTHPDTSAVNIADADEADWVNEGEIDDEHYYESNVLGGYWKDESRDGQEDG
ncbi:hypothetical protein C366_01019 [Cryptococcus neoformans Tu401-1]|nr:hypothetical protein C366_01019 [Cryptococcus neoformans var. grubii Tu401-1]